MILREGLKITHNTLQLKSREEKNGMKDAIRAASREGTKSIEAVPVSIAGLGAAAFTSSAATVPSIIMKTTKKAADANLTRPAILAQSQETWCYGR